MRLPLTSPQYAAFLNALKYAAYVLLIPFVFVVTELFVLPIDFYGFRSWESLRPYDDGQSYGPFYPNINTMKNSAGDTAPHGEKMRVINMITDKYGFRNEDAEGPFDIVITGDSYIGGAHLKQEETLSSVLAGLCHCRVYNYGAISYPMVKKLLVDARFKGDKRPKYWIVEMRPHLNMLAKNPDFKPFDEQLDKQVTFTPMTSEDVLIDRFKKLGGFHYLFAYWFDWIHIDMAKARARAENMIWDEGKDVRVYPYPAPTVTENNFEQGWKIFNSLDAAVKHTGMIPIYLIAPWPDRSIDPFIAELAKTHKVIYFGPGTGFPISPNDAVNFRFREDTHWRPEVVRAAAERLRACLDDKPTCAHMPPIALPEETHEVKKGACIYDDKLFANGSRICSANRLLLTCAVPPQDQEGELGTRLQWLSLTSSVCGRSSD